MKKATIYSILISLTYVGIATLAMYKSIINIDKDSIFYSISMSGFDFFKPGYSLGFKLGFVGGNLFLFIGQLLTFFFFFIIIKFLFSVIESLKTKDSISNKK